MDELPREELINRLALARYDGEPWEHTAKICETINNSMLLIAAAMGGSSESLEKLSKDASHYMPAHVREPKPKPVEKEPQETEIVKDATTLWMERMISSAGKSRG